MRVIPIRDYGSPKLPTNRILDEHPELLKLIPKRWQHNTVVLSALTALCVLISAGRALEDQKTPNARVAPVFQHGDGRGSFGCKAINPPVYFTEDEARQVINDEARRSGIVFGPGKTLQAVTVQAGTGSKKVVPLQLDGTDAKRGISYEFVSYQDAYGWGPYPTETAFGVDAVGPAKALQGKLSRAAGVGICAVFYEPFAKRFVLRYDRDGVVESSEPAANPRDVDREQLRAQVRDFIKWLKAQKVI